MQCRSNFYRKNISRIIFPWGPKMYMSLALLSMVYSNITDKIIVTKVYIGGKTPQYLFLQNRDKKLFHKLR